MLNLQSLGKEPFQRLSSLMQIKHYQNWWRAENSNEKEIVINGFKELYLHSNEKKSGREDITKLLMNQLDIIINDNHTNKLPPPPTPKSRARDINGFSQQEIIKVVSSTNLQDTAIKMKYLLNQLRNIQSKNIIVHTISKQLLKKKKEIIETSNDLRGISIMPAIILAVDKITIQYAREKGNQILSKYQHGARSKYSTNTAKINLIYLAQQKGFTYSALLDLSKAYDKVNRNTLKKKIEEIEDINLKKLLLLIIEV